MALNKSDMMSVLLLLVLLPSRASSQGSGLICPYNQSLCSYTGTESKTIYHMTCSGFGTLDSFPFSCSDPRTITDFTLQPNGTTVSILPNSILSGLRIQKLVLSALAISSVHKMAFEAMGDYLQVLYLGNNLLTDLPVNVFNGLNLLNSLRLDHNQFTNISESMFNGLGELNNLDLSANLINSINPRAWIPLQKLKNLDLSHNHLVTVESISGLSNLSQLNLQANLITSLQGNLFTGCNRLEELDLSANNISSLRTTNSYFDAPLSLKTLKLSDNNLEEITEFVFSLMGQLEVLSLRNNRISIIYPNSFSGLVNLKQLDVTNNWLTVLPLGMFDPLGKLTNFTSASNVISQVVKQPFQACRDLQYLDLSNNKIVNVTSDWFSTTTKLLTVRLQRNRIASIESGSLTQLTSLVELDLSDNQLPNVTGLFVNCSSLQTLDLSKNPLGSLVAAGTTFAGLTSLSHLNLSGLCLTDVAFDETTKLGKLMELDLSHNLLQTVTSRTFSGLSSVQVLDLAKNNINAVDSYAFTTLLYLTKLNLSFNSLTESIISSAQLSGITVDVSWNRIRNLTRLPASISSGLYLYGNPIQCDCAVTAWLTSNTTHILDANKILCSNNSNPQFLFCHSSRCNPQQPENQLCSAPLPVDTGYLQGIVRLPETCSLDAVLSVFGPRFVDYSVEPTSLTSVSVSWNISDIYGLVSGYHVTVMEDFNNCTNITATVDSNDTTIVYSTHFDKQRTSCLVQNLTTDQTYITCTQVTASIGNSNTSTLTDSRCTCQQLLLPPAKPPEETTTATQHQHTPTLVMSSESTQTTIRVTWYLDASGYGSDHFYWFRLTCVDDFTWLSVAIPNIDDKYSYVLSNLTQLSSYNVCVEALTIHSQLDNVTSCTVVNTTQLIPLPVPPATTNRDKRITMIIAIVVAVGGFLLLVVIIVIVIVCCRRRIHKLRESGSQEMMASTSTDDVSDSKSAESGKHADDDVVEGKLAEQTVFSMDISCQYDVIEPLTD